MTIGWQNTTYSEEEGIDIVACAQVLEGLNNIGGRSFVVDYTTQEVINQADGKNKS